MKNIDIKKSIMFNRKIQQLIRSFNDRKSELAASYQGYHELLGFVDQCQRWGITDRGQEKALDDWIRFLQEWPFGGRYGILSHNQRQYTLVRDKEKCTICGGPADEVHHLIPRSKGGRNEPGNLISVCFQCHEKTHRKFR